MIFINPWRFTVIDSQSYTGLSVRSQLRTRQIHRATLRRRNRGDIEAMNSDRQPLFRKEALEARRNQWLGPVLLVSPPSHTVFAVLALIAILALALLISQGAFTRKARVNGWLVPAEGLVRVFPPQPGVIAEVKVIEGQRTRKGDPLIVLSDERKSSALGATQAEVARLLAARRASLRTEIRREEQLLAQQRLSYAKRIAAIRNEIAQFSGEIELQTARTELARASTERMRGLERQGFAAMMQVQQQEELELEQRGRTQTLQRTRAERQRELVSLEADYQELPIRAQAQIAELARGVSAVEQELAQTEAKREIVIPAPQSGVVTAIQADPGGHAQIATALLSIVPEGVGLNAHLFASSKAVGFVRPGQTVLLRFQAYPYQKFGHHHGTVESVSKSSVSPGELPTQLFGLSSLTGTNEAIYRIAVKLDRQSVTAYGLEQPLQAGMQLESDILLDRRKLWEWMLEPLFTLTGRL